MTIDKLQDILKLTKPNPPKGVEEAKKITLIDGKVIPRYIKENI